MQGRITEQHLPLAEKSHPGIGQLYRDLEVKPATFLQLLWVYEGLFVADDVGELAPDA